MARVVDFCPGSDDEASSFDSSSRGIFDKKLNPTSTSNESPRRDLVPKSAAKSVNRKVRRLETNSNLRGNLLFQRCDSAGSRDPDISILRGSPRKSPLKKIRSEAGLGTKKYPNDSIFESDSDSPPQTARKIRGARPKASSILEDDESGDEIQPAVRMAPLLQNQTPGLRRVQLLPPRKATRPQIRNGPAMVAETENEMEIQSVKKQKSIDAEKVESEQETETTAGGEISQQLEDRSISSIGSFDWDHIYDESDQTLGNTTSTSTSTSSFPSQELRSKSPTSSTSTEPNRALSPLESNVVRPDAGSVQIETESSWSYQTQNTVSDADIINKLSALDLSDESSRLQPQCKDGSDVENEPSAKISPSTPPQTPSKPTSSKGLMSPSKLPRIPKTPHRPSVDAFWNQDVVNSWNDQHSPRKLVLPAVLKSPTKTSPSKDAKKAFEQRKHAIAHEFLQQLDSQITEGKIAELSESTGGVHLVWSKTLNTTAGRANWKRETTRTRTGDGSDVEMRHKHHASIELAEKVIDDENRLLNVVAHEFCHLANFMLSGITNNPHGKEFKVWANKCSRAFADKGVKVTTKHTYEIDFKYIWECSECGSDYKRHSKSIDPQRHRCGSCKGALKQTKPMPRGGRKPSAYQVFVKEQMKIVKEENPGSPQKDLMKLVAAKWAARSKQDISKTETEEQAEVEAQLAADMGGLTI